MAFSYVSSPQPLAGDHTKAGKIVVADYTFDASYATGGEAIDFNALGVANPPWFVAFSQVAPVNAGYVFQYDYTNKKIVAYRQKDPANAGGADIALTEVANTTDLSAVTIRVLVYGLSN